MLATVECKETPVGLKSFLHDLLTPFEIEANKQSVPGGDPFYRVGVPYYRGEIPTVRTAEKLKKLKGSVIFDINFPCDENTRCLEFHPSVYPSLLLFNTFTDCIPELCLPPMESSLTVYDSSGIYSQIIEKVLPFFSKIQIYTKEKPLYEKTAGILFDKYGISLVVSEAPDGKPPKSTVALCAEEVPFSDFYSGLLFTLSQKHPPSASVITAEGISLPAEYELLRPSGVGSVLFASALYEKCNVKKLGELSFKKVTNK
ncbi:MAG: hypothetical protein E7544_00765 [Ruminococcaceae bacterium]|nr:hypothetical protein [Oscillospiraceae bacterium]